MAKTAQDKFNEYLDECRDSRAAVDEFARQHFKNTRAMPTLPVTYRALLVV